MKRVFLSLAVLFVLALTEVSSASAVELLIQNTMKNKIQVAVVYKDDATGAWTTMGWYTVEPNSERRMKAGKARESSGIYFHAQYKGAEYTAREIGENKATRWVRNESFTFDNAEKPKDGTNLRTVTVYQSKFLQEENAFVYRVDGAGTPPSAPASASTSTEFVIQNTLSNNIDVALIYYDKAAKAYRSCGWYSVEAKKERRLKFNNVSEPSKAYFHVEYKGSEYSDKRSAKSFARWVSNKYFDFTGEKQPSGVQGVRSARYYETEYSPNAKAFVYRVDKVVSVPKPAAPKTAARPAQKSTQSARLSLNLSPNEVLIGGRMTVKIDYSIQKDYGGWFATLNIYNSDGKLVRSLLKKESKTHPGAFLKNGSYSMNFNAKDLDYDDYTVVFRVFDYSDGATKDIAKVSKKFSVLWRR